MTKQAQIVLAGSLLLNLILIILLISTNQNEQEILPPTAEIVEVIVTAPPENTSVGQIEPTSAPTIITVVATPTMDQTEEPTSVPNSTTATQTPEPTLVKPSVEPTLTPTFEPTPAPTTEASPTLIAGPEWLVLTNQFRLEADLPQLVENSDWSNGSVQHSQYMVNNTQAVHYEDINNTWYRGSGNEAGINGLIAVAGFATAPDTWAIDYWMSATFHALPLMDPQLAEVGYGAFRDPETAFEMAATMDVERGRTSEVAEDTYPVLFPADGGRTWVLANRLGEFPDPLVSCGISRPTGPPIIAQIGSGDQTPRVTGSSLTKNGQAIPHCIFDETSYTNPNRDRQRIGRQVLDKRDAIILIPHAPLEPDSVYSVEVEVNGEKIVWEFQAVESP